VEFHERLIEIYQRGFDYEDDNSMYNYKDLSNLLRDDNQRLRKAITLAECQYQGCGGRLTDAEIVSNMRAILSGALNTDQTDVQNRADQPVKVSLRDVSISGVQNTPNTQCDYVMVGIDNDNQVWVKRSADDYWMKDTMLAKGANGED
jgi:hypothetical protein